MLKSTLYKIEKSNDIIKECLCRTKNPYLSCSFGKDSIVMLYIVLRHKPDIPVVWFDGGRFDELPETYGYVKTMKELLDLNLTTIFPEISYVDQLKKYGLPDARFTKQENIYTKQFIGAFKKEILNKNYDCNFVGMRASESKYRRFVFGKRGSTYHVKSENILRCCPVYHWQTENIWDFIDSNKIPYHPVYDKTLFSKREDIRLGVLLESCFGRKGSLLFAKYYYPELFNEFSKLFPGVRVYV